MSIIKLLCRYQKDSSDKDSKAIEEELKIQEVIQGDKFDKDIEREKLVKAKGSYEYGPMVLNLKDVCMANSVDEEHTVLRFYNGVAYTFKISFDIYEAAYQAMTGLIVHDFTEPDVKLQK